MDSHDCKLRRDFTIVGLISGLYLAPMKKLICLLMITGILSGCKKQVQEIQEDLVIMAMTSGQWKMTSFSLNGTDRTSDFAVYRFKYNSNYTVDAVRNGIVERSGTWNGSASTMTIMANFPSATTPIDLINGNWNITRNGWSYVEATQSINGDNKTLRLDKE
jgi:hypothetical protein